MVNDFNHIKIDKKMSQEELSTYQILHTKLPGKHIVQKPLLLLDYNTYCLCYKYNPEKSDHPFPLVRSILSWYYKKMYRYAGTSYFELPKGTILVRPYIFDELEIHHEEGHHLIRTNQMIFRGMKNIPQSFFSEEEIKDCRCYFKDSEHFFRERISIGQNIAKEDASFECLDKDHIGYRTF